MNSAPSGFQYLMDGFKLIFKPGLKRFLIIPVLINIILFFGLFFLAQHYFSHLMVWLNHHLSHWLSWLVGVLWVVFAIGFLLVMTYSFVTLTNIIGGPFNNLLSEKVEFYLTEKRCESGGILASLKDIPRVVGRQFSILAYYLPRAVLLLVLFFIPVLQIIAGPLWFVFNAWFMALQCLDYPTDNHKISLEKVKHLVKRKRTLVLSFGISVLVMAMIPGLNLILIPAAVAGATKLWHEQFTTFN